MTGLSVGVGAIGRCSAFQLAQDKVDRRWSAVSYELTSGSQYGAATSCQWLGFLVPGSTVGRDLVFSPPSPVLPSQLKPYPSPPNPYPTHHLPLSITPTLFIPHTSDAVTYDSRSIG